MSEKLRPQAFHCQRLAVSCYLLLCNNLYDALTYNPFFSFKCCESVDFYLILLEVARELSRFCEMAGRLEAVGPHWASTLATIHCGFQVWDHPASRGAKATIWRM